MLEFILYWFVDLTIWCVCGGGLDNSEVPVLFLLVVLPAPRDITLGRSTTLASFRGTWLAGSLLWAVLLARLCFCCRRMAVAAVFQVAGWHQLLPLYGPSCDLYASKRKWFHLRVFPKGGGGGGGRRFSGVLFCLDDGQALLHTALQEDGEVFYERPQFLPGHLFLHSYI